MAHVGLAEAHNLLAVMELATGLDAAGPARKAATEALALDPGRAEALRRRRDGRGAAMDNSGNVTLRRPREFDHRIAPPKPAFLIFSRANLATSLSISTAYTFLAPALAASMLKIAEPVPLSKTLLPLHVAKMAFLNGVTLFCRKPFRNDMEGLMPPNF